MNFEQCNPNGAVEGFCLIKTVEKKMTAKGIPFLDLSLADSSGEINAKLWDYKAEQHGEFTPNMLVKVRGTIAPFNDVPQLRVERIRPAEPQDEVRIEDFVPSSGEDSNAMYAALTECAEGFADADLKKLVLAILEEYKERLLYWPAAYRLHHAVRGGLLYHTLSILRLAQRVAQVYPFVDCDLLFSGVILHDICKIEEYEVSLAGIASGYTTQGSLVGHLVRGAIVAERVGTQLEIPQEKLMLVQHMLISHHGEPDFGAAMRPMFLEAELLSQLDLMDARVYEIMQAQNGVEPGGFSNKQWMLDNRKIYNHGRGESEFSANLIEE